MRANTLRARFADLATAAYFAEAGDTPEPITFELPEDLTGLTDEELAGLREQAVAAFDEVYQDGAVVLTGDEVAVLQGLKDAKDAIDAESVNREQVREANAAAAAELAAAMRAEEAAAEADEDAPAEDAEAEAEVVAEAEAIVESAESVTAAAPITAPAPTRRSFSVPRTARRASEVVSEAAPSSPFTAAVNVPGLAPGQALTREQVGDAMHHALSSARSQPIQAAQRAGQRFSQRYPIAQINRTFAVGDPGEYGSSLELDSAHPLIKAATSSAQMKTAKLPNGSLVASGGWCAPSETLYDLCELESRDGLISLPEINVSRGGIRFTTGPDWSTILSGTGFTFTEANDEDGNYDGAVSGTSDKPCDVIPCPAFTEVRLEVSGVCISGGNLQNRAYPEMTRRYVNGAVTAHFHRVATNIIADMIAGSTAVTPTKPTGDDASVTAPLLSAIELQAEDIKYRNRMARGTVLEAVFPFWVRGAIRADLSRREGLAMFEVSDAMINTWFAQRGINAQFVYNFDNLSGAGALVWPSTVRFLIYPAGTWVRGSADIISLEMLHDSVLNAQNNYTAIFTEEGWSVMKMCDVSRIVSVAICPGGQTGAAADYSCA